LDRAAAFGALEKRTLVEFLEGIKSRIEGTAADGKTQRGDTAKKPRRKASGREAAKPPGPTLIAFTDGASRGNPGEAACAVIFFDEKNEEVLRRSKRLGKTTNNVAEYEAVLMALELAEVLGARRLELRLDSELVVRQLNGEYKVKHASLKPLFTRARKRMEAFERVTVTFVPRAENDLADKLANDQLDGKAVDS
jgi:ribonuclease HI